ncbi:MULTISPECIES: SDR family NAD(P)-dependent oxidoreductase [Pacificibacter]|uniref:SDR family NAD(P)-dependent oxidoreductase n=1 Tax=Pacificibacter TaxID=1042323 RepID=UPI001C08E4F1|nr:MULTISPECIES: SDR family NAD(P)-dependent oxidoreductase [Pacificibacter]MBU2937377.1 SDR family NAD(P)-dependent oxidoreductase [Pacificibacter marinus]MDO6615373.1 SDR family NAD(P)-dependent oxidoreductase [Pacificibacter sp. 1_MG-2023]
MRSILITGSSSGIGYHAATTLKAKGWHVLATCRKQSDCDRLQDEGLDSFVLDYEDPKSVERGFNEAMKLTGGTLDALYNNGAYAIPAAVEDLPVEALRQNFEANFFGWHDLTRRVIPVMRAQGHGHIIQCSSVLGLVAMPWRGSYNSTKFALEGLTDTLRLEMRGTGIHVVSIEPGPITSDFRLNARKEFDKWIDWETSARADQYRASLVPRLYEASKAPDRFELGAEAVTNVLIKALNTNHPRAHYYVTTPTWVAAVLRRLLPTSVFDAIAARS